MDYETTADLNEAHYYAGLEADMEMAQWAEESRAIRAAEARGICSHGSGLGHLSPPFYTPEDIAAMLAQGKFGNRAGFTGGQDTIGEGNVLCTECGEVRADEYA